ncbi:exopolysaccharide biosynthesis protein [Burkholderia ubonensis]|uniref:low molecular weight protein-tyrosine-phosphatase n=1 Tax=Burkholderia ubonensis TaxID=101571 RepID=UPI000753F5B6|nr:low molecular weight protein-tyrosine-phosphatase [Burkholderia ubonensis]KVR28733.1 exopolysaccharide biosynthesis protein [Burkholderia ubonensis]KVT97658.1 exopolysaccharide biosynthesis protein [Burkholderia ubonensis]KWD17156.1 exopolysaccharide biosynthesis protein [Burkholderia ubonensis]KWD23737.1 exopolysaccharide biosynthesis protein [Burkholderia ubonensis]
MFRNILIVCHANVCRSPAAELLFKSHAASRGGPRAAFHSAGVDATVGEGIDPVMRRLLAERGVDATTHRSRRLSRNIVREADLILVSERAQIAAVESVDPFSRGKVHLLGKWEDAEIADPHGGPEAGYRRSYTLIERLVQGWLQKLC